MERSFDAHKKTIDILFNKRIGTDITGTTE